MFEEEYKLIVFDSTHHSLTAEDILKDAGYKIMMVPVLPEISADCGIAIKLEKQVKTTKLLGKLNKKGIELAGLYQVLVEKKEKKIKRLD
ncbi:Protein of unknown function (DUF3343) [Halobacteroides halobius DSM 5150]|uniref:Putative Se/S carrier protein-like domain-containing protein n=1 Tax=Halobacteroides halobius (strain ATCC 35273 / DSM 5150 / MD-1) TaxID=748449 RepID=L0KA31_HALHC|nr:DUF3343 domain-containing protein [Halobacteroides halobius]AGB41380.1 Protein of unknown function (DUF3343) [Halobacteroides halobius DSM 5150]